MTEIMGLICMVLFLGYFHVVFAGGLQERPAHLHRRAFERARQAILVEYLPYAIDPGIRDRKKSGSGMNIPDRISESFETIFWVKNTYIFYTVPGPGSFSPWIRDGKFGSGIRYKHPGSVALPVGLKFVMDDLKRNSRNEFLIEHFKVFC
jgi:hypothetical protein